MVKRYKPLVLAASVLLLALLMQYCRTGTWLPGHALMLVLFYTAGMVLALLSWGSQPETQKS